MIITYFLHLLCKKKVLDFQKFFGWWFLKSKSKFPSGKSKLVHLHVAFIAPVGDTEIIRTFMAATGVLLDMMEQNNCHIFATLQANNEICV